MPLWYLDFLIFTPADGPDAPVFIGVLSTAAASSKSRAQGWPDLSSTLQKLRWSFRLMIPSHRGVGWNWQVKGVPSDSITTLLKWAYARTHLQRVALTYLHSVGKLVIMGFSSTMQKECSLSQAWVSAVLDVVVGWSGAIWVWDRLNYFYSLFAALSVASAVCETCEWPPLTGQLRDAWSVRQMWRCVDRLSDALFWFLELYITKTF